MPCLESTCNIFSTLPPLSRTVTLSKETNKRTSLQCKPLTRSKNEDTSKITTLLQSTLHGQISPIKKEENTLSSPIVCIHCRQLLFYRTHVRRFTLQLICSLLAPKMLLEDLRPMTTIPSHPIHPSDI